MHAIIHTSFMKIQADANTDSCDSCIYDKTENKYSFKSGETTRECNNVNCRAYHGNNAKTYECQSNVEFY